MLPSATSSISARIFAPTVINDRFDFGFAPSSGLGNNAAGILLLVSIRHDPWMLDITRSMTTKLVVGPEEGPATGVPFD